MFIIFVLLRKYFITWIHLSTSQNVFQWVKQQVLTPSLKTYKKWNSNDGNLVRRTGGGSEDH